MSKTDQFWEGESKITQTCTSRHVNTDGNVTCTLMGYKILRVCISLETVVIHGNFFHAFIALELWILKVGIMYRFPLFYIYEGMKSLTNNKSLHPCG